MGKTTVATRLFESYENSAYCGIFIAGHSIISLDDNIETAKRLWVKGLGLIPYLFCPHYNDAGRETFDVYMQNQVTDGIALENYETIKRDCIWVRRKH